MAKGDRSIVTAFIKNESDRRYSSGLIPGRFDFVRSNKFCMVLCFAAFLFCLDKTFLPFLSFGSEELSPHLLSFLYFCLFQQMEQFCKVVLFCFCSAINCIALVNMRKCVKNRRGETL